MQKNISIWWFLILSIFTALSATWFNHYISNYSFVKFYIIEFGVMFLTLITLWYKRKNHHINYHLSYIKLFFGLLFLLGTISLLWSKNYDFSIAKWLIWLIILLAFYLTYNLKADSKTIFKFSFIMLFMGFLIAIVGIMQWWFDFITLPQAAFPASTFGNKNMATHPLVLIYPLGVYLLFSTHIKNYQSFIVAIFLAIILTFEFYTQTRTSWLAMIGQSILIAGFLIFKRHSFQSFSSWNIYKTISSLIGLIIFLVLINFDRDGNFQPFWNVVGDTMTRLENSIGSSNSPRYAIWGVAFDMFADNKWLGTGIGSWFDNQLQQGYNQVVFYTQRVHNDILELMAELGIVGLVLFLSGIIAVVIGVWKILQKASSKRVWFYYLLFVGIAGSFVNMQFSFPYQLAVPSLIFGLYLGFIAKKSEDFIGAIRIFTPKLDCQCRKLYRYISLLLAIILFYFISKLLISWIISYEKFNTIHQNLTYSKIDTIETPIIHFEIFTLLNQTTYNHAKYGNFNAVIDLTKFVYKHLNKELYNIKKYAFALYKTKKYQQALDLISKTRELDIRPYQQLRLIELSILYKLNKTDEFVQRFEEIVQKKEILKRDKRNYKALLGNSLRDTRLHKYSVEIYNLYNKYFDFDCSLENNIALYYFVYNQKAKATKILQKSKKCLNKGLVKDIINM